MKKRSRRSGIMAFVLGCAMCIAAASGLCANSSALEPKYLVPVGKTIGIKLFSDGVVVIGLSEVETAGGKTAPGADCGLRVGDVIEEANGTDVESSEQFLRLLQCGGPVELEVSRDGEDLTLSANPVRGADGMYRLGAWIRDSLAGIGTVTYYDPETGAFGALGHGVTDGDTGLLMPLGDGAVMTASVKAVKRGCAGEPGQLRGEFDLQTDVGTLSANTEQGVFGTLETAPMGDAVPVAGRGQVHEGKAKILANVAGETVAEYEIEIVSLLGENGARDFLVRVTDETLIAATGGIVQGMSGSPIIQDGRLVGAITHVLVNDPTKGYGVLIENMLKAAG